MKKTLATVIPAVLLSACATYAPMPLDHDPAVLTPPVAAVLSQGAMAIDRPYLTPTPLDLGQPLDLNAIAVIAVVASPELKAQRVRAGVSDAQLFAARLLPDPTLSLGIDHILSGPDPVDNLVGQVVADLNALRTRRVVLEGARAAASQVRLDLAWAEWQVAGQARLQAVRIAALTRILELSRQSRASAQGLLDRSLGAAGRGDLSADQVQAARLAALDATDRLRTAERDLTTARFELARLIGLPPESPLRLGAFPQPAAPPDAARLFTIAQRQRLDLKALEAGYASQEAAVHKAVLDQFPTLTLTITGNRDTGNNKLLGPAVGFTLPLWNRNRGGIAVARATRDALKAEYEARLFQTRAEISAAVGGIALARRQRDALLAELPALQRFSAATTRAAQRGDLAPATAQTAAQALRDKQLIIVQLDQALAEQTIALELLTGVPQKDWTT